MKLEIDFEDLKDLIDAQSEHIEPNTSIIKVDKVKLIQGLEETEKDILDKFSQARKLWKKNMKLYRNFLGKNPGSKQMKSPGPVPQLPSSYEEFKGYKRMLEATAEEELVVNWTFLREIFNLTTRAINEVRTMRNTYALATGGTTATFV